VAFSSGQVKFRQQAKQQLSKGAKPQAYLTFSGSDSI